MRLEQKTRMKINGKAYGISWLVLRKKANSPFTRTRKEKEKAEIKTLSKELGAAAGMVAHLILPVLR